MKSRQLPPPFGGGAEVSHSLHRQRDLKVKKSKRSSAKRPQLYRNQRTRNNNSRNGSRNEIDTKKLNTSLMRTLINSRKNENDDPSPRELEDLLDDAKARELERNERRAGLGEELKKTVGNTKVTTYGNLRVDKKDCDAIRIMSLNINSLSLWKANNPKVDRLKHVARTYGIDVLGLQETNTNFALLKPSNTIAAKLRHGDDRIKSTHAHNTLELDNVGNFQAGGTAVVVREELAGLPLESGKDTTGLGMFSWYRTETNHGVRTYFISAYAPCKADGGGTYYQHIQRYIQENKLKKTNPKDFFRRHLVSTIKRWRNKGDRVVLMIDSNENVQDDVLSKALAEEEIRMREAVHKATGGRRGPPTHFRGNKQKNGAIDGIYLSEDIELIGASYLPFDADLGDHRPVVVDVQMRSVLGTSIARIVRPTARRLNSKVKRVRHRYLELVRKGFKERKIEKRIKELERIATFPPTQEVIDKMEKLDKLVESIMTASENRCRIIYPAHYEFSPEIQNWLDRCHLLKWMLRYHQGKRVNAGNMRRFARRLGVKNCMKYSAEEVVEMYRETKAHTKDLMAESAYLRKNFLHEKLNDAIANGRDEEANRVRSVLRGEAQRKQWQGILRATKPRGVTSVTRVEVTQEDGTTREYSTKESVEEALMTELRTRFGRAATAPICQGVLYDLLGVYADTDAAIDILEGRFVPPADVDQRTLILLEEIANIWRKMGEGEVSIAISTEDYQYYWKHVKERISSSISGLHFGHYKSIAHDDELSSLLARKLSLITKTGAAPERWARGLSVMLEKIAGVALVTKLRAILLLEADYNYCNKLIFGKRMLELARQNGMAPEEIYSEKGRTAEDAILQQVLMYDIARMTKRPLLVAQCDAAQCYDRVALPVASLTLQAFKTPLSSTLSMLRPLHNMEYYLRTAFGQSTTYFGGKEDGKHGLAQGNGAAPPTWQQVSTLMINAQKNRGHGVEIECPISKKSINQVGILYVDDTCLWAGLGEDDDVFTTGHKGQTAIDDWGTSLNATGGLLKGDKCSVTIHDLQPNDKGEYVYTDQQRTQSGEEDAEVDMSELDDLQFYIPTNDGGKEKIKKLGTDKADNNLGLYARPDGKSDQHFEKLRERVTTWTAQVKGGSIPTRSVWMSYTNQLWMGLRYGLGACSASIKELSKGLATADYYMLSSLGVVRSITTEWRYLPSAFGGIGLYDLPIETAAANLSMLLQHYEVQTKLGITLKAAIEHLQIEIGVSDCPFNYDYDTWSPLATDSWVKALWEKIDKMGIVLEMQYTQIPKPRENDSTIMNCMVELGVRGAKLISVNRVRLAQESLFLSDITTANGKKLESQLLNTWWKETYEGELGKHRSTLSYGRAAPTAQDWKEWKKSLKKLGSNTLSLHEPLGRWINPTTRKWRHMLNTDTQEIEEHTDDRIYVYAHDFESNDRTSIHTPVGTLDEPSPNTIPVNVSEAAGQKIKLDYRGTPLHKAQDGQEQMTFLERLCSKGGDWMWKSIKGAEDLSWVLDALERGSLYCVSDGSYLKRIAPHTCSAAWVIYCAETRKWCKGELVEHSIWANSYRGEQLGMLAIHLLLLTIEEHYGEELSNANIFCDNKGTIHTFSKEYKRVSNTAKNNDILRTLRRIQQLSSLTHKLNHVKAHQDDTSRYDNLSLESKLNVDCDKRAKQAIRNAVEEGVDYSQATSTLPMEAAAVYINGIKQTSDLAKELRYYVGQQRARQFYADEGIIAPEIFDTVEWNALRDLLERRPRMYQIWYGKQCSGFCGTGARQPPISVPTVESTKQQTI
jgi:endonuclease/exonuclease/phosphatase family metal-dependent hydrolase